MAIRLEMNEIDPERGSAGTRRAELEAFLVGDDPIPARWVLRRHVERIARELAALLQVGDSDVSVRASFRRYVPMSDVRPGNPAQKVITIRVPARHWEALLTELDAVAAMLPDAAAGATVVIEDDTPPPPFFAEYDAVSVGGSWSNAVAAPPLTEESLRATFGAFLSDAEGASLTELAEQTYDEPREP